MVLGRFNSFLKWFQLVLDGFRSFQLVPHFSKYHVSASCCPGCDAVNFEINLISVIKSIFYMTKKLRQKTIYSESRKSFKVKLKAFFIIFTGFSTAKNCLRPDILGWLTCKTFTDIFHIFTFSRSNRLEVFCRRCSQKFRKSHRKTSVPESLF